MSSTVVVPACLGLARNEGVEPYISPYITHCSNSFIPSPLTLNLKCLKPGQLWYYVPSYRMSVDIAIVRNGAGLQGRWLAGCLLAGWLAWLAGWLAGLAACGCLAAWLAGLGGAG